MARSRHPKKEIEDALTYAEELGWRVYKSNARAHSWGTIWCPFANRQGCIFVVYGTPKNAQNFAIKLRKVVSKCSHQAEEETEKKS